MRSNRILLKATEFCKIPLNFNIDVITDFTADLITSNFTETDFTMYIIYGFTGLHCIFHRITDFTADFIMDFTEIKFHATSNFTKTKIISWDFNIYDFMKSYCNWILQRADTRFLKPKLFHEIKSTGVYRIT